jgi:hypothetical protein
MDGMPAVGGTVVVRRGARLLDLQILLFGSGDVGPDDRSQQERSADEQLLEK